VAVGLVVATAGAFADAPTPQSPVDVGGGFISHPAVVVDGVSLSLITPDSSPMAALGLAPMSGIAVDYDWGHGIRSEIRTDLVDSTGDQSGGRIGTASQVSLAGNLIYDFEIPATSVGAHVGAGFGVDSLRLGYSPGGDLLTYQFLAGTEYALMPDLKLGAEYRFLGTAEFSPAANPLTRYSPSGHSLLFTLRYDWGASDAARQAAPAPMPLLPAAAAASATPGPPVEPQRLFQIFFDVGDSEISETAAKTIRRAADSFKSGQPMHITVTGHTDTVGTLTYDQDLSERRAAAVKRQLEVEGVSPDRIKTVGAGMGAPPPPIDSGEPSPNSQAEIVIE
jgi:outer membrane protein OmpA-like peptidoglycan-associated protein/opacity protein-like surface antigen